MAKDRLRNNPLTITGGRIPSQQEIVDGAITGNIAPEVREITIIDPNALIPKGNGRIAFKRFTMTPKGLEMPDDVSEDELNEVGEHIAAMQTSMQWVIGDWMNSMDRVRGKGGTYEIYAQAFGVEPETLMNWVSVCNAFEFSTRIEELSFGHHRLVTKYPAEKRKDLLLAAVSERLSVADFREALKPKRTTPTPQTLIQRLTSDFVSYSKGLESMGQGERAQLKQLAKALISQIEKLDSVK